MAAPTLTTLPFEIRTQILRDVLVLKDNGLYINPLHNGLTPRLLVTNHTAILRVCRSLYADGYPLLVSENTFAFTSPTAIENFVWYSDRSGPGVLKKTFLKHVIFLIDFSHLLDHKSFYEAAPWVRYFAQSLHVTDFPCVKHLKFDFSYGTYPEWFESIRERCRFRDISDEFLPLTKILVEYVRAPRVSILGLNNKGGDEVAAFLERSMIENPDLATVRELRKLPQRDADLKARLHTCKDLEKYVMLLKKDELDWRVGGLGFNVKAHRRRCYPPP